MPLSAENQAAKDLLERRGVADPDLRLRSILAAERVTARGCQRASDEADGNSLRDIWARLKRYNLTDELVERIIGRKRPRDGPPDSAAAPASKAARVDSPSSPLPCNVAPAQQRVGGAVAVAAQQSTARPAANAATGTGTFRFGPLTWLCDRRVCR